MNTETKVDSEPQVLFQAVADLRQAVVLLGGKSTIPNPGTAIDAHDIILAGLPGRALTHLVASLKSLRWSDMWERALGISLRSYQRHKEHPDRLLSPEQSGRAWKFAEILARTTALFGSQEAAEEWLGRPAMGLDQRIPLDLLATPAGLRLVEDHLMRIEYGVYA